MSSLLKSKFNRKSKGDWADISKKRKYWSILIFYSSILSRCHEREKGKKDLKWIQLFPIMAATPAEVHICWLVAAQQSALFNVASCVWIIRLFFFLFFYIFKATSREYQSLLSSRKTFLLVHMYTKTHMCDTFPSLHVSNHPNYFRFFFLNEPGIAWVCLHWENNIYNLLNPVSKTGFKDEYTSI